MTTNVIKLQTNLPLIGYVNAVWHQAGKKDWVDPKTGQTKALPDQVKIDGVWDDHGEGSVYLPDWFVNELGGLPVVAPVAGKANAWTVLTKDRKIRILKAEIAGGKKQTTVEWADGDNDPIARVPAKPVASAEQLRDTLAAKRAQANQAMGAAAPTAPGLSRDEQTVALYHQCWGETEAMKLTDQQARVAATATLFIARSKLL